MGTPLRLQPAGLENHVREGEAREVLAHVISHVGPHAQQNALAFVVARAVAVRLAKVAGHDGSIDGSDNFGEGDVDGVTR